MLGRRLTVSAVRLVAALLASTLALAMASPSAAHVRASGGLRLLRAPDVLRPQGQARHRRAGSLAGEHLRRRLRADLAQLRGQLGLRAQGGPRLRLDPGRRSRGRPGACPDLPRPGLRHRRRGQRARAGPSDGHHVHHLERPHLRVVPGVREEGLPQLELPDPQDLLQDAAPPRPHAHLAEPRRRQGPHQLVRRSAPRTAPREPTPPASRPPRSPCATADRCRSRTAGSAVRCASAPGCARTSRLCGHR